MAKITNKLKAIALIKLARKANYSKKAKIPLPFLKRAFKQEYRGLIEEAYRELYKDGYVNILKRQREYVVILTNKGVKKAKELEKLLNNI